jgi:hypothetical protein
MMMATLQLLTMTKLLMVMVLIGNCIDSMTREILLALK